MKVIAPQLKSASIAVSLSLYDKLQPNANFISQIPETFKGFQTKPNPYFIMEENMFIRLICEMINNELNQRNPDTKHLEECQAIHSLLVREKPVLIFVSFHA